MFGTDEQKQRWLAPLVAGEVRSFFSMTEPEVAGSDPTLLRTRAVRDGDEWVIDGHKWFSSGADGAAFAIVMAVTDPDAPRHERATQIIVPADTPGVEIVRPVPVFGHTGRGWSTHCEVRYTGVRVPVENTLGGVGAGFMIAQKRLGPGRIHHVMRWLGQMQRAFELMCRRALEREAFGSRLADKQTVQNWIADSAAEIQACRLMTLDAAHKIDAGDEARVEVSVIKFYAARVLHDVIDRAIQVHGALGHHRTTRRSRRCTSWRAARASTTARTRCTAWSSRGGSSRHSRRETVGGSRRTRARDDGVAAGRLPAGVGLRARGGGGAVAGPGRGARPHPLGLRRPVPARPHEHRAVVRERLELGDVMTAQAVGEVVESNDSRYEPGDMALGQLGWQDYAVARGGSLRKVPPGIEPQLALHVLGATGLTAYFGLLDVAEPVPGDTVVVSGAAGAVGSVAGQIAPDGLPHGRDRGRPGEARRPARALPLRRGDRLQERGPARCPEGRLP